MSQGTHGHKGGDGDKDNKPPHHEDDKYGREDLHEPVDWMVYSHERLYEMVHTGVNLESANAAATNWQKIAEDIANVRQNLFKAVENSTDGWDGKSAQLAREGLITVTDWVHDTSTYAQKVSSAITTETNNVEAARAAMPPPPAAPEPPVPNPAPVSMPTRLRDQVFADRLDIAGNDAFIASRNPRLMTTLPANEFTGFNVVGASAVDALAANDASHRRAADVMAAFQRNSAAVDQTVPSQFTPPVNPVNPVLTDVSGRTSGPTPDTTPAGGAGGPVPAGTSAQNRGTTNTSSRGGSYGSGGYGRGGGGGGMGGFSAGRTLVPNSGNSGSAGGGGGASSSGGASGVVGDGRGAGAAAAAASSATGGQTKAFQNPLAMGGAPMAGAPAAGGARDENREHKSASYLEEDDNVFGLDRKAAPPVIGQ